MKHRVRVETYFFHLVTAVKSESSPILPTLHDSIIFSCHQNPPQFSQLSMTALSSLAIRILPNSPHSPWRHYLLLPSESSQILPTLHDGIIFSCHQNPPQFSPLSMTALSSLAIRILPNSPHSPWRHYLLLPSESSQILPTLHDGIIFSCHQNPPQFSPLSMTALSSLAIRILPNSPHSPWRHYLLLPSESSQILPTLHDGIIFSCHQNPPQFSPLFMTALSSLAIRILPNSPHSPWQHYLLFSSHALAITRHDLHFVNFDELLHWSLTEVHLVEHKSPYVVAESVGVQFTLGFRQERQTKKESWWVVYLWSIYGNGKWLGVHTFSKVREPMQWAFVL